MPTEKELLALCLRWIQNPQGDAFDKAMLIEAIKAKLEPEPREWVGLELSEMDEIIDGNMTITDSKLRDAVYAVVLDTMTTLMEKNT